MTDFPEDIQKQCAASAASDAPAQLNEYYTEDCNAQIDEMFKQNPNINKAELLSQCLAWQQTSPEHAANLKDVESQLASQCQATSIMQFRQQMLANQMRERNVPAQCEAEAQEYVQSVIKDFCNKRARSSKQALDCISNNTKRVEENPGLIPTAGSYLSCVVRELEAIRR